ncbi:hypothetical protein F4805DRAFT_290808 [Annulohypoxylon moriforme]|nr:hypothetical protein F4805DRAFT_290808 [Annulohypoxylon moriforme]
MGRHEQSLKTPFLAVDDGPYDESIAEKQIRYPQSRLSKTHKVLFMAQIIFGFMNLVVFIWNISYGGAQCVQEVGHNTHRKLLSSAESAVQYTVEIHSTSDPNPFAGPPRLEVDQAWSHLLRSSMIKLSKDEMRMMNKTSIALRDGTGYIGYLESLHMLHCVKRLYQSQHTEYYAQLQHDNAFSSEHLDHCFEILRKGIMCNADVAINTYFWDSQGEIKADRTGPRRCTNWDQISEWADERTLELKNLDQFRKTLIPSDELGSIGPAESIGYI